MLEIKNECVGCLDYCIDCGARHTERFYCDRCEDEDKLYYFGDEELCGYCVFEALSTLETSTGICDQCGEEDVIYSSYGLCEECLRDGLEIVEGSE